MLDCKNRPRLVGSCSLGRHSLCELRVKKSPFRWGFGRGIISFRVFIDIGVFHRNAPCVGKVRDDGSTQEKNRQGPHPFPPLPQRQVCRSGPLPVPPVRRAQAPAPRVPELRLLQGPRDPGCRVARLCSSLHYEPASLCGSRLLLYSIDHSRLRSHRLMMRAQTRGMAERSAYERSQARRRCHGW